MTTGSISALAGGFADPGQGTARTFRSALNAMARPGRIETLASVAPPGSLSPAAATLILTLCDGTTPVHLSPSVDGEAVRNWLAFQTGAPIASPEACAFAVGRWDELAPIDRFSAGTPEYPDRSATLFVEVDRLEARGTVLRGPGIRDTAELNLPETEAFRSNAARFPLGLDFFFTAGDAVAALPRTTKVG